MTRALVRGAFDFKEFDPNDRWSLRKLRWVIDTLEKDALSQALTARHLHWVILASHGNLSDESFKTTQQNAAEGLQALFASATPWLADKILKPVADTGSDAISKYIAEYGQPGDPRFDAMVATLRQELSAPPRTDAAREASRRARRLRLEAELKAPKEG